LLAEPESPVSRTKPVPLAADGSFRIEGKVLGPHRLVISARAPDGREQRIEQPVELVRGDTPWKLALATGILEGEAAPGTRLTHAWTGPDDLVCKTRLSADEAGRYRIAVPAGTGELELAPAGGAPLRTSVDVRAGEVHRVKAQ
jgi:hypothetical protein